MDWQQLVSLAIVGVTVAVLVWSRFRHRKFSFERGTHCGCTAGREVPGYSVVFRARKGGRPEILVKMK